MAALAGLVLRTVTFSLIRRGAALGLGLLATGCAHQHYFQDDARLPASAARPALAGDSVWATAGRQYNHHGWAYRRLMGPHHRALWAAPVKAPTFQLATAGAAVGALTPTKLGGGFQSTSLTLETATGMPYVIRSLDKDPSRIMPKGLQKTFLANALRDGTAAGNPYAALVVPPLAQALGVPHAHPRLLYVPLDEASLGSAEANERLRGKLVLLEEKYSGKNVSSPLAPTATNFISDEDMRKRLYAHPADQPDQPALLRARLLDVLIGDWDRHAGQWQWAERPDPAHPGRKLFAPVPKDRDQAFFRMSDGLVPWLMTRKFLVRHLVTFKPRIHDVHALTGQGRHVDQRGVPELTRRDFDQAALYVQQHLPDSTLARAVRCLPPAVYALEGPRLLHDLQARRDQLPQIARQYYLLKARRPTVPGTELPERFLVVRTPDSTTVRVYNHALGPDSLIFARTYLSRETRHLTLEGLGGDDVFELTGHGLPVVAHGGAGQDVLRATSHRRVKFEQEASDHLPVPAPRTKKERFKHYDRLEDE
ncbi:MAG: hypothetical protein ACRYFX_15060 [Janthinobacterium lividum]